MSMCILYERDCIDCGECNICDLDKNKICDNCGKCIELTADYSQIDIDDIVDEEENALPVAPAIDQQKLKKAWEELKKSGKWVDSDEKE